MLSKAGLKKNIYSQLFKAMEKVLYWRLEANKKNLLPDRSLNIVHFFLLML